MKKVFIAFLVLIIINSLNFLVYAMEDGKDIFVYTEEEGNREEFNKQINQDKINELNALIQKYPDNFKLHYLLAEAYRNIENYEAGIVEYSRCIQIKQDDISTYIGLATVFRNNLKHPEKLIYFLETYKKYDSSLAYYALGSIDQPLDKFSKITNEEIFLNNENILKDVELDIEYLKKSIEINPQFAEAHFELGNAYKALALVNFLNADKQEESLKFMHLSREEYEKTIAMNPNHIKTHYYLAEIYYNEFNNIEKFLLECEKIIGIDPKLLFSPSNEIATLIKDRIK